VIIGSPDAALDGRDEFGVEPQTEQQMSNLDEMSRLLHCHDWDRIEHWATAIGQLADLTDAEITELQRLGMSQKPGTSGSRRHSGLRRVLRVVSQAVSRLEIGHRSQPDDAFRARDLPRPIHR
jgi:hypothetical protein